MDDHVWLSARARAIYEITRALGSTRSQQDALNLIVERVVTDLGYRAASLRLLDKERQELELRASFGLSEAYLQKGAIAVVKSGVDRVVLTGQPAAITDVRRDAGFQYPEQAEREGLASMLAVPLLARDRVIGVLHIYTADPHDFTVEEQDFVSAIGNLSAQAIERARLYDAFRRIAREVNSSLELKDVLGRLLMEAIRELNVKAGSIRLLGPRRERLHLAVAYGLSDAYLKKGEVKVAASPIDQRALAEGKPSVISDLTEEGGFQYPEEAAREGIRAVLVLPLLAGENPSGVLRLYSGQARQFGEEEIDFAQAVGDLGAVAIENAKLHEALKERLEALKQDVDGWYRYLGLG